MIKIYLFGVLIEFGIGIIKIIIFVLKVNSTESKNRKHINSYWDLSGASWIGQKPSLGNVARDLLVTLIIFPLFSWISIVIEIGGYFANRKNRIKILPSKVQEIRSIWK